MLSIRKICFIVVCASYLVSSCYLYMYYTNEMRAISFQKKSECRILSRGTVIDTAANSTVPPSSVQASSTQNQPSTTTHTAKVINVQTRSETTTTAPRMSASNVNKFHKEHTATKSTAPRAEDGLETGLIACSITLSTTGSRGNSIFSQTKNHLVTTKPMSRNNDYSASKNTAQRPLVTSVPALPGSVCSILNAGQTGRNSGTVREGSNGYTGTKPTQPRPIDSELSTITVTDNSQDNNLAMASSESNANAIEVSRNTMLSPTAGSVPNANSTRTNLEREEVSEFTLLMRKIDQISVKLSERIDTTTSVLNKKVEVLNQRSLTLESSLREIRRIVDRQQASVHQPQQSTVTQQEREAHDEENIHVPPDINDGILTSYSIPMETLRQLVTSTSSRGNFACRVVERLFPELFGPDNLRYGYSYNGSYSYRKKALDPTRLKTVKKYLLYFYPELKDAMLYQKTVIDSINERLRRPDADARRRARSGNGTRSADVSLDNQDSSSADDDPIYTDMFTMSSNVLLEMPYHNNF